MRYFKVFLAPIFIQMNRIKEVLEEKNVKQTWLAEKIGKSFNMVNSYVSNRRQPSIPILFEIANVLNVSVRELLTENVKN
jgi:transcriptional regulator with XRE-family HTH domain